MDGLRIATRKPGRAIASGRNVGVVQEDIVLDL
jgi:hypothetical protein